MEDFIIILAGLFAYILVAVYIGYRGYRSTTHTLEDYFLAGRGLTVILLFFTIYATYQSAYMYIGVTGFTYTHGVGIWYSNVANLLMGFMFLLIGVPLWKLGKNFGYITQADFFAHRFDSDILRLIIALWMVLGLTPYIGSQVLATGRALSTISEGAISFGLAAALYVITVIIYTSLGGLRGVAWTDLVQGLLMLVFIWVGIFIILGEVGGIGALFEKVQALNPELLSIPGPKGLMTPAAWLGFMLADGLGCIMWIQGWMRFYVGKTWKTMAMMSFLVPIGTTLTFLPAMLIGLSGTVLAPGLTSGDQVFPTLMINYLPVPVTMAIIVGLFAASMSTVDSLSLALSASISKDIYARIQPQTDEKRLVRMGRLWIIAVIVAGGVVGYAAAGTYIVVLLTLLSLSLAAILFPVAIAGIYWKGANKYGSIAGIIAGVIVGVKTLLFGPEFYLGVYGGLWAILACAIVLIIVSLITPTSEKEKKAEQKISNALASPVITLMEVEEAYKLK
ncbi:MAG: sodium:solute symporter family protein [Theionarchaea archaeon]|nr:sodium:solute symporter family protein [Theionarchaea archaeon]